MCKSMFNFTPPHCEFVVNGNKGRSLSSTFLFLLILLFAGLIFGAGYRKGVKNAVPESRPEDGNPVYISKSLFHDRDSVMFYYEQGLRHEDPKGLYVLGIAAILRYEGTLPEDIYAPSLEEGYNYLLAAANLGYPDAIQVIYCMHNHACWPLPLPQPLEK